MSKAVEGSTTSEVFEAYLEHVLAPTLRPGQVVVMDNLTAHKGERVRDLIEGREIASWHLPTALLARLQPHRRSVRQAQGAGAQSRGS